jgi:hypothetical protein
MTRSLPHTPPDYAVDQSVDRVVDFTSAELRAMHEWCCAYRELVRLDGTPTPEQDKLFLLFQRVCYSEGVANGCR